MTMGGMAASEHSEALKNEKDQLRSLDSQHNSWSESQRAPAVELKEPLISCSFRANLAENQNKFYFCRF